MKQVYISQGEEFVSGDPDVEISTVLGSCVSMCLWDPEGSVGGMNHLLLPDGAIVGAAMDTTGAVSMERLINAMVRKGALRSRLRAKMFGGASMLSGLTDIGARNIQFSREYLRREGIPCDAESTGGTSARRVRFSPSTGAAKLKFVKEAPKLAPASQAELHAVELF